VLRVLIFRLAFLSIIGLGPSSNGVQQVPAQALFDLQQRLRAGAL